MRNYKLLIICFFIGVIATGCELPKKPDFTTSHTVEAPILINKEFQFLGGGGSVEVLIDTTKSEFDSLFILDNSTGLISVSKEEDFDFGDLNDAIPTISTDPTSFNAEVGELEVGSFSSGTGNIGEANFEELTGIGANTVSQGSPVPPQVISPEVTIDLDTDDFESAIFKSGSLDIVLENNLGYNLDDISITLVSDPDPTVNGDEIDVVNSGTGVLDDGTQATVSLAFNNGDELINPAVRISIAWTSSLNPLSADYQEFQRTPVSMVVVSAIGNNLFASSVSAALESQDFSTSSESEINTDEFSFTSPNHYVELESGTINIASIINSLELGVETLRISFPGILAPPADQSDNYIDADSLVIDYTAGIPAKVNGIDGVSNTQEVNLAGYRIYATNNKIPYTVFAQTENTKAGVPGTKIRTISEVDKIESSIEIQNLKIAKAFGEIRPQTVSLGDDDPSNGDETWDLYNESEVELTEISGLEDISSQISGLEFTQATLSINYESNIGVPTTIYAAFLGINGEGEEVFLRGKTGQNAEVSATDPITGILKNGTQLLPEQMIKFELDAYDPITNPGPFSLTFDSTNSTVTDFLNNLPSEIRFVGKAIINESGTEATIASPLEFTPRISVDLPLAFRTTTETIFTDTTETDALQDLPKPDDDQNISEGILVISYENGLPLGFSLSLTFLDSGGNFVDSLPIDAPTGGQYDLLGASVDETTRFATTATPGTIEIALTDEQLSRLYKTASIIIESNLRTTQNSEVKFRPTDSIKISVSAKISLENDFKGN